MSQTPDLEHKRKRSVMDAGSQHNYPSQKQSPPQQSHGYINFLPRQNAERLALIQADGDTFADILHLLAGYEGALDRQESLAANLGAKLTGPRILKGIERFFDGPIKTNATQPFSNPIGWIDVVLHAKAHPNEFVFATLPNGTRCCQFHYKGLQCEITEDDWRLISSGALDRFPLEHPFEEDETAELATLDILESRASILYKRADEVAARARILHHRIGQRKHDLSRRRNATNGQRYPSTGGIPPARLTASGAPHDLHADLLQQFLAASAPPSRPQSVNALSPIGILPISPPVVSPHPTQHRLSIASGRSASSSHPTEGSAMTEMDHRAEFMRSLVTQKSDKLKRGDIINPACDRCRRLRLHCIKHLTACQGCTKKHAKCTWRTATDEEVEMLKRELGIVAERESQVASEGISPHEELPAPLRPSSRAETEVSASIHSAAYSPGALSSARSDLSAEAGRMSLPPVLSGLAGPPPLPRGRDPSRLNQVASLLADSSYMRPPFNPQQPPPYPSSQLPPSR
ncbi:Fungal transcriptional regulatory protein [Cordyceps fumosorosea ARSEF 2679]|uniref:Fungal transcriptional regulatory protein n=1 Tax=Cordyceps fumosorosea (strain ARSEF 2679) TaxID=1081104 RepID=A0A167SZ79_CORFA|nr:Fungal transcriptional regulatory protein [Cordyceps fumosorosea ARSEF 2679]OAA60082.1 Fungal transcriptional regulatory protein [Cordyceps fumosorosea ARSEF 2679]